VTTVADAAPDPRIVVMGVSGSGKSLLGARLAQALGVEFLEGDELHPRRNIERMAAGIALTDADRAAWLAKIAARLRAAHAARRGLVVACSALKRAYRDRLRAAAPELRFVFLHGDVELVAARQAARQGHFMPPSLVASQFATLETPSRDERVIALEITAPPAILADAAIAALREDAA
jgi:gluconokinase